MRKQLIHIISVFFILLLFGCTGNIEIPTTSEPENTQTSENGNSNNPTGDNPGTNPTSGTDDEKSSSSPVYTITIADLTNGTVTPDKTSAKAEETVTLTVTPEWGYELASLTVTDSNNKAVTVTDSKFTMPAANVTVNVSFKKIAFSWDKYVDSDIDPDSDCGTITDFTVAETADGCSFHITFNTDDRAEASYSQSHVAVRNVYVKGGVLYKFSWQDFSNYGTISLASFWLDCAQKWFSAGASNSLITPDYNYINYVYFKTDEDDVLTITFRPNHVSDDYEISNFKVEPEIQESDTEYTITMPDTLSNGTVTVDKTTAKAGETVTFNVTPEWGYYSYIWVTDSNNNRILVTDNKFTMPSSNVTVSIRFSQFDSSNYEWVCGVDDPKPADPGEMTNYQSSGSGCSFDIQFKDDEPYDGSYSASKVAVKNIYVKGGVLYRFSWTSYLKKDNSFLKGTSIKLNGFYLNRAKKWLDSAIPNNNIISYTSGNYFGWGTDNSVYCMFDSDEVIDVVFRPVHISASYTIYNFKVEKTDIYNVTFDTNGGSDSPSPQRIFGGQNATKPENPTKEGYIFAGWQYNGSDFDFKTPISDNITLTAQWKLAYKVIFDSNGGSEVTSQVIENGKKASYPVRPKREGYVFKGWRLSGSDSNFDFYNTPITDTITLTAQWNPLYTVTFNSDGGSDVASRLIENGTRMGTPDYPKREGYVFKGWRLPGSDTNFDFYNTPITDNITLIAQWKQTYTVTFDTNGGSEVASKQIEIQNRVPKPEDPTKEGYYFLGWLKDENYFYFDDTEYDSNITLSAQWSEYYGTKAPTEAKEVGDIVFSDGSAIPYADFKTLYSSVRNARKNVIIAIIFYKGTELNSDDSEGNPDTTTSRTLGLGLKRCKLVWCTSSANAYKTNITTIACTPSGSDGAYTFAGDKNGSDNLEQIAEFLNEKHQTDETVVNDTGVGQNSSVTPEEAAELYPAFYYGKNYKDQEGSNVTGTAYETGWYLPTSAELFQIYVNGIGPDKVLDIGNLFRELVGGQFNDWFRASSQHASADIKASEIYSGTGAWHNEEKDKYAFCYCIREFN